MAGNYMMNRSTLNVKRFLLPLVFILLILTNLLWLRADRRPFAWDESIHYLGSVGYARTLAEGGPGMAAKLLYQSDFYPPLAEFLTALVFRVTGASPDVAAFLSTLYLIGIVWLLWLIGRRLFTAEAGLLGGLLFVSGSMVIIQSKFFMLDLPLVFFFCLGFYVYLLSDQFSRRSWSLMYGAVLGLALLTKWSAVFFLGVTPVLAVMLAGFRKEVPWKIGLLNLGLAYLLALVLAAPWYSVHFLKLVKNTHGYVYDRGVVEADPSLLSPASWLFYVLALFRQLSWPMALLVLAGLTLFFKHKRQVGLWLLWVGVPYVILTLIRNKDDRYTLPLAALACVAAMAWVDRLQQPWRRRVLIGIIGLAVGQFVYVHLGERAGKIHDWLRADLLGTPIVASLAPDPRPWPLADILQDVRERAGKTKPVLRVIPDDAQFSTVAFKVADAVNPSGVQVTSITGWPEYTDFAVTKTGSLGLEFTLKDRLPLHKALADPSSPERRRFALIRTYPLPDGSDAMLFQRQTLPDSRPAEEILDEIRTHVTRLLSDYVQEAQALEVDFTTASDEAVQAGELDAIRIRAENGLVGDFKHKPLGVPFKELDLEVADVCLDLGRAAQGEIVPLALGELRVRALDLRSEDVNHALSSGDSDLTPLHLDFSRAVLRAEWRQGIGANIEAALTAGPDAERPDSDNLRFRLRRIGTLGWTLPAGWLQPFVEDFNPLIQLGGFAARVKLGNLTLEEGRLSLSSEPEPSQESITAKEQTFHPQITQMDAD